MKTMLKSLTVLAVLGALTAYAVPINYEIGDGSYVNVNDSEPGLVIQTSLFPNLSDVAFTLDDGVAYTFTMFTIWTDETWIDADDTVAKPITAYLDFDTPASTAQVDGSTEGRIHLEGQSQGGVLTWDGPTQVTTSQGVFEVSLSDAFFNWGYWWDGVQRGEAHGANVYATVTQISSVSGQPGVQVPDGGMTLALMGLALLGLRVIRRK